MMNVRRMRMLMLDFFVYVPVGMFNGPLSLLMIMIMMSVIMPVPMLMLNSFMSVNVLMLLPQYENRASDHDRN